MGKSWTEEQKQVIELNNRSLLVSAAAGSGKTAVLVERIIQKVTSDEKPMDLDQLLVVTFTKAAASEMRERIMGAIDAKLERNPENSHLQKQKMLLPSAMITTIDSFCMSILKEHFDALNLDPGFRVGDPQEMILLKQDVAEQLLEDYYTEGSQEFMDFASAYSRGKLDQGLVEWILKIYDISQSYPWPEKWLDDALQFNPAIVDEENGEKAIVISVVNETGCILEEMADNIERAFHLTCETGGPELYAPMLEHDLLQIREMQKLKDYYHLYIQMHAMKWDRLSGKKQPDVNPELMKAVKELRQEAKDLYGWLKKNYYSDEPESMLAKEKRILPGLLVLLRLTKDFSRRFQEEKLARNIIDFNDQEHFALQILLDENMQATEAAKRYRRQFEEIMCDEYQDSNQVQETLLTCISREEEGNPNIFVVGDVKQSIYRFRLAEPEIFLNKYDTFTKNESLHQRIDLHKNFRSRACVLDGVNEIFRCLMTSDICGMDYDSDAALYPGLDYSTIDHPVAESAEWILVEHAEDKEITKREAEAKAVGQRILELLDPEKGLWVMDKDSGVYRKADYGDVVILLRTVKNWTEDFVRILKNMGIPAIGETSSGFFDTLEIQGIMNMLRILDNPLQDIPLAAVLTSCIGGFSDEELAKIRLMDRKVHLYNDLLIYTEQGEETLLIRKIETFMILYDCLRDMKIHCSIEELIREIYDRTGYAFYMMAMPGGEVRKANLERLIQYAKDFRHTSYRGLFHFIRYVDQLKEAKEDVGEAVLPGNVIQSVRIMSIHKSKGLEYPICIVAGMGKIMNFSESRSRIVVHSKYGVAADGVDLSRRTKIQSLSRKVFARKLLQEQMGEEIRVLYVAMTRAREKLILVGTVEDVEKTTQKWEYAKNTEKPLSFSQILKAKSYLDWLGPIFWSDHSCGRKRGFDFRVITLTELACTELHEEIEAERSKYVLDEYLTEDVDQALFYEIDKKMNWQYPKIWLTTLQGKMTVSELKKMAGEEMPGMLLYPKEVMVRPADDDPSVYLAQQKGTATHKIFELLPFGEIKELLDVENFIGKCLKHEWIPDFWKDLIPVGQIYHFCQSDLGRRMAKAEMEHRLYRERPFVMGVPVKDIYLEQLKDIETEERILIQGIIDVYFEEDDGVVLLDYKTDRIPRGRAGEELLVKRYKTQLDYYQMAIEQITGKKVNDRILYSVIMNKEIHC